MADYDDDAGSPTQAQFCPQEPIMGALVETARSWVAFTSGKPLADWSGQDTSKTQLQIPNNPSQWRHAKDDGYKYRCNPLDVNTKFARNGNFAQFGERLFKCFQACCQETVTYVPLLSDNTIMESVLLDFVWFNKNQIVWSTSVTRFATLRNNI